MNKEEFNNLLRKEIEQLEKEKGVLKKKFESKWQNFINYNDKYKILDIADKINSIDHTINHLYMIIGKYL